jgi:hypothetical protein
MGRPIRKNYANDPADTSRAALDEGREQNRPNEDDISRRAYARFEARGREDGHDLDDWLEAERDLKTTTE